jgi:hypothetical protein
MGKQLDAVILRLFDKAVSTGDYASSNEMGKYTNANRHPYFK